MEVFDSLNYLQCKFNENKVTNFLKEASDQFQLEDLGGAPPCGSWMGILAGRYGGEGPYGWE